MPWVGFEPTIPVSELAKTFHVLDRAATVIGFISNTLADFVEGRSEMCSEYGDISKNWGQEFDSRYGQTFFCSSERQYWLSFGYQAPFLRMKWPVQEAHHASQTSAEIKIVCNYSSTLPCIFMAWYLFQIYPLLIHLRPNSVGQKHTNNSDLLT
jgi:hypothetical protein